MYGPGYYNPQLAEQQQKAREERQQKEHDDKLKSSANGGQATFDRSELETQFMPMGIPKLKELIQNSDPDAVEACSEHWTAVHNILSGGGDSGSPTKGSVAGLMQTAVENVLEHWQGDAAEAFRKKANEVQKNIINGAYWAHHTAKTMKAAATDLRESKKAIEKIEEPSGWDSAWDRAFDPERDDSQLQEDIKKGAESKAAAEANAESLSLGKQRQMEAVAVMEPLAFNYTRYAKPPIRNDNDPFPPPPSDGVVMPPPVTPGGVGAGGPGGAGGAAKPWNAGPPKGVGAAPTVPRDKGITGGSQLPAANTNTNSLSPGLTDKTSLPGGGGPGLPSGGGGGSTGGANPVVPGGGPGLTGGGGRTGPGPAGGRGGIAGGGAGGANRGAAGRAGMGGMGGGGMGAGGRAGAGAGGRGALAKARGGVVGAAKGITGKGTGGGAGLHGSRGGSQRGGMAGGMAGGMGGGRGRRPGEDKDGRDRPDYLVEDEETWISEEDRKKNVPKNIE
ncbi:hypothetical protein ACFQVC_31285 [Streptomyces monticola]|uniref:WXG100 family type VII secretion target n=1 Tax=Streptomyces monticola TaxID=2666263 RepID=A0ABW2JTC5_9ACTN